MKQIATLFCFLFFYLPSQGQVDSVRLVGRVMNEQDQPLPGVTVVSKNNPGLGTITDDNGEYSIKIQTYERLIFSSIGYEKKEVLVKEQSKLNVVLKRSESSALDEITVTALGPQQRVSVTGAVTTVDVKDLETPTSSITNALAGRVPGIIAMQTSGQPGDNISEFWIRGISTFGGGRNPLVLVDGFERSLDQINIDDIASFTVLKDASATAVYGSRGANGVILIKTKRGQSDKISINAKYETSYKTRTFTPEFVNGYTYAKMMNEARITRNTTPFYSEEDLDLIKEGLDPGLFSNIDWMNTFLKDGSFTEKASLNINGGSSKARYYVSGSYLNEGGMYVTDPQLRRKGYNTNANYKRWNYRANFDMNITNSTLLRVGIGGYLGKQNLPGGTYEEIWNSLMGQNPISIPIKYPDGRVASRGGAGRQNPYVLITQQGYMRNWTNSINSTATLEQDFDFVTKGLKFIGRFGYDNVNHNYIRRMKWPEGWEAERLRDSKGELVFHRTIAEQTLIQTSNATGARHEFLQAELHYDRLFSGNEVGAIIQYTQSSKINTSNIGDDIKEGIAKRNQRLAGRVTYGFKRRYYVDFNFGYTGSQNFARGHRFALFPAISGAWNISEEPFVRKRIPWMDMFKVRFSYGKVGNDYSSIRFPYLGSFATYETYNYGDIESGFVFDELTYSVIAANDISWEIATKKDLGIDISFLDDDISGTIDLFRERRKGILMTRSYIPATVGLEGRAPKANVGSVLSRGFDGNIKIHRRISQLDLTVRGNITYSKNTILKADEPYSNYPYTQETGFRVNQNRGLIAVGLFEDYKDIRNSPEQTFGEVMPGDIKYKDVNGDGKIDGLDVVPIGATAYPNLVYGFGISALLRNFDINILFQGSGKVSRQIDGFTVYPFSAGDWGNILKDVEGDNRWILGYNEDPHAKYPRLSYGGNANNYRASTYWLRDMAYLRLKTLEVGYTLPGNFTRRFKVNNLRVYLLATNLLTFSQFKLWDPELSSSNGQQYPLSKIYTVGIKFNL